LGRHAFNDLSHLISRLCVQEGDRIGVVLLAAPGPKMPVHQACVYDLALVAESQAQEARCGREPRSKDLGQLARQMFTGIGRQRCDGPLRLRCADVHGLTRLHDSCRPGEGLQAKDRLAFGAATRKMPRSLELEPASRRQAPYGGFIAEVRPYPAQDLSVSKSRYGEQSHICV